MSRRTNTWIGLAMSSVLVGFCLCGGCLLRGSQELPKIEKSATAFMELLAKGDLEAAYLSTSPEFQAKFDLEAFRKGVDSISALKKQEGRTVRRCQIFNGTNGVAIYSIPNPPNPAMVAISLRKEKAGWRVVGFGLP